MNTHFDMASRLADAVNMTAAALARDGQGVGLHGLRDLFVEVQQDLRALRPGALVGIDLVKCRDLLPHIIAGLSVAEWVDVGVPTRELLHQFLDSMGADY